MRRWKYNSGPPDSWKRTSGRDRLIRAWPRAIAWVLFLSILLPLAQAAYGATGDPEAGIPVCCRTHGKHKCFMLHARSSADAEQHGIISDATVTEKCPCPSVSPNATAGHDLGLPLRGRTLFSHRYEVLLLREPTSERTQQLGRFHRQRGPPVPFPFA